VIEMCHWCITCLNQGIYQGRRILTPASFELMWTPVAEWGYPPLYEDVGLGWTLGHYENVRTISHGGMGFGWTDFLTLLPEKQGAAVILCNEESSARSRTIRAALHAILGLELQAGTVSWMVPICQALLEGGIRAAYEGYAEIKDNEAYFFDEDDLVNLTYQLMSVKKLDLTIDVLKLNLHAFPEHVESLNLLAKFYIQKGEHRLAEECLRKALAIQPDNSAAMEMLEKIHMHQANRD